MAASLSTNERHGLSSAVSSIVAAGTLAVSFIVIPRDTSPDDSDVYIDPHDHRSDMDPEQGFLAALLATEWFGFAVALGVVVLLVRATQRTTAERITLSNCLHFNGEGFEDLLDEPDSEAERSHYFVDRDRQGKVVETISKAAVLTPGAKVRVLKDTRTEPGYARIKGYNSITGQYKYYGVDDTWESAEVPEEMPEGQPFAEADPDGLVQAVEVRKIGSEKEGTIVGVCKGATRWRYKVHVDGSSATNPEIWDAKDTLLPVGTVIRLNSCTKCREKGYPNRQGRCGTDTASESCFRCGMVPCSDPVFGKIIKVVDGNATTKCGVYKVQVREDPDSSVEICWGQDHDYVNAYWELKAKRFTLRCRDHDKVDDPPSVILVTSVLVNKPDKIPQRSLNMIVVRKEELQVSDLDCVISRQSQCSLKSLEAAMDENKFHWAGRYSAIAIHYFISHVRAIMRARNVLRSGLIQGLFVASLICFGCLWYSGDVKLFDFVLSMPRATRHVLKASHRLIDALVVSGVNTSIFVPMCIAFWLLVRCSIVGVFNVMNELLMQGLVYKVGVLHFQIHPFFWSLLLAFTVPFFHDFVLHRFVGASIPAGLRCLIVVAPLAHVMIQTLVLQPYRRIIKDTTGVQLPTICRGLFVAVILFGIWVYTLRELSPDMAKEVINRCVKDYEEMAASHLCIFSQMHQNDLLFPLAAMAEAVYEERGDSTIFTECNTTKGRGCFPHLRLFQPPYARGCSFKRHEILPRLGSSNAPDANDEGSLAYAVACDFVTGYEGSVGFIVFKGSTGSPVPGFQSDEWKANFEFGELPFAQSHNIPSLVERYAGSAQGKITSALCKRDTPCLHKGISKHFMKRHRHHISTGAEMGDRVGDKHLTFKGRRTAGKYHAMKQRWGPAVVHSLKKLCLRKPKGKGCGTVFIVGHSLGGGLAQIAGIWLHDMLDRKPQMFSRVPRQEREDSCMPQTQQYIDMYTAMRVVTFGAPPLSNPSMASSYGFVPAGQEQIEVVSTSHAARSKRAKGKVAKDRRYMNGPRNYHLAIGNACDVVHSTGGDVDHGLKTGVPKFIMHVAHAYSDGSGRYPAPFDFVQYLAPSATQYRSNLEALTKTPMRLNAKALSKPYPNVCWTSAVDGLVTYNNKPRYSLRSKNTQRVLQCPGAKPQETLEEHSVQRYHSNLCTLKGSTSSGVSLYFVERDRCARNETLWRQHGGSYKRPCRCAGPTCHRECDPANTAGT